VVGRAEPMTDPPPGLVWRRVLMPGPPDVWALGVLDGANLTNVRARIECRGRGLTRWCLTRDGQWTEADSLDAAMLAAGKALGLK